MNTAIVALFKRECKCGGDIFRRYIVFFISDMKNAAPVDEYRGL
jgi:hypothetical protein